MSAAFAIAAAALTVLKWIGIVLLIVLALLLLILLVPAGAAVDWTGDVLTVKAGAFGLYAFKVYPRPAPKAADSKKKKAADKTAAAGEKKPEKKKEEKGGVGQRLADTFRTDPVEKLSHILHTAGKAAGMFLRRLHISGLNVYWPITGADAADTAITYGRAMAGCGVLLGQLEERLKLSIDKVWLEPDYTGELAKKRHFACQIHAQLYIILVVGIYLLVKVLNDPILKQ